MNTLSNHTHTLVEQYVPLANKLAYQKKRSLPAFVDVEELVSAAYLGLVEAANRFDPVKGIAFSTFAFPRISGAINDHLRSQWRASRANAQPLVSLDQSAGDATALRDTIEARPEKADRVEELFDEIVSNCDDDAKNVLRLYYIEETPMKEVGRRMGVSESRISQLIKGYKTSIRSRYEAAELAA